MTDTRFIEAETADFEEFTVSKAPMTSARTATEDLIEALNDASVSATVSIHRQSGSGKECLTFLESFAPDKYDSESLLMHLRNAYGGGDYRIHVREGGKLRANRGVSIETPKNVSRETNGNNNNGIIELLDFVQKSHNQMAQMFRENQAKHGGEDNEERFLDKMIKYKALFGGDAQKSGGISELLGAVDALKLLGVSVGGVAPEPEDGFAKIIESAAPVLTALLSRQPQAQPMQQRPQRQAPEYKPNPSPRETDDMSLKVKLGIATLVKAAEKNADTGFYADFVFDQVPHDILRNIFASAEVEKELAIINPKTLEHKDWFVDLGEHLKGMLGITESKYFDQYNQNDLSDEEEGDITPANE